MVNEGGLLGLLESESRWHLTPEQAEPVNTGCGGSMSLPKCSAVRGGYGGHLMLDVMRLIKSTTT